MDHIDKNGKEAVKIHEAIGGECIGEIQEKEGWDSALVAECLEEYCLRLWRDIHVFMDWTDDQMTLSDILERNAQKLRERHGEKGFNPNYKSDSV